MLNPTIPDEVAVKMIPRQRWQSIVEIFALRHFQGIVLVRRLHYLSQVMNVVFWILALRSTFAEGSSAQIFAAIIIYPILLVFNACIIRLLSEVVIAVLLLPSLLTKHQPIRSAGEASVVVNDADLAAYGVTTGDDMGATV